MPTFKGTKGKECNKESIIKNKLKTNLLDNFSPTKPILPPLYSESEKDEDLQSSSMPYPQLQQKYSVVAPQLLAEIITINSAKNNAYTDIMKITSTIDLVFDK